jgi:hypothetical protein
MNSFACSSNDNLLSSPKSKNTLSVLGNCLLDSNDFKANKNEWL